MDEILIPPKLQSLIDKWVNDENSLKEPFQTFVDSWANDEGCSITRWCRDQENIVLKEAFESFIPLLNRSPEIARVCYYHIGWLVPDYVKKQWFEIICKESIQAVLMWLEDTTTSADQDKILETIFRDPISGVPEYCFSIDKGEFVRKKINQRIYNEDSEIVLGILNGTDHRCTTNIC